ncbi:MAG: hypothetical protein ABJA49_14720, partial [Betaproteobacteria bacterium]
MIQHWISSNVLLTAFLVLAGGWLLLKSRLGQIAIVLLILFFMVNDRLFSQSDLPVGGAAGNAMQAAQFGVNAQSNEAICLGKAMTARTAQSSNPRLAGAAAACTQVQAQAIRQCAQQTANLLVADKLVKCQGEAE